MGKIQNLDVSLQDLVAKIDKGEYHIPKFQRDFVWKNSDIESLGDSIIRSYPISSMLVMPINGTLTIGAGSLKTNGSIISKTNGEYVLDGQQRITSIARIFLGLDNKKEYYFDLLSMLIEKFPEDNVIDDPGIQKKIVSESNYNYSKISDSFCKSFPTGKAGDEKNTRQHNRFISGRAIIENRYGAVINKFLRSFSSKSEDIIDKYTDYLNGILGGVGGYGIPMTLISGDSDLGLVIRVFEKVNSTGKNLALFDLINAKTFKNSANDEGLADFLFKEIHSYCDKYKSENTKVIQQYFDYVSNIDQYKNFARVIRIIMILDMLERGNYPHFTKTNMFTKDANFWFEKWKEHGKNILDTIIWLEELSLITLSNKILIEYMIPIIILFPKIKQHSLFRNSLKKFILYSNIKQIGFSKTNLDVVMKFYEFAKQIVLSNNSLMKHSLKLPINMELNYDANDVLGISIGKNAPYVSVLHILFKEQHNGLGKVDFANSTIDNSKYITQDEHHIFAKSRTRGYPKNSLNNSIANITLLNSAANRWEIKDRAFGEYMSEMKQMYSPKQFSHILAQNYIDVELVNCNASEEDILKSRAEAIAATISSYFSNQLIT